MSVHACQINAVPTAVKTTAQKNALPGYDGAIITVTDTHEMFVWDSASHSWLWFATASASAVLLDTPAIGRITRSETGATFELIPVQNGASYEYRMATSSAGLVSATAVAATIANGSFSVTGLSPAGTEYYIQVRAKGNGTSTSDSQWSASQTFSTTAVPLAKPAVGTITPADTTASVSITAADHATATKYRIATTLSGLADAVATTATIVEGSVTISSLTASTEYYIQFMSSGDTTHYTDSAWTTATTFTTTETAGP